jgi:hypothetical protein
MKMGFFKKLGKKGRKEEDGADAANQKNAEDKDEIEEEEEETQTLKGGVEELRLTGPPSHDTSQKVKETSVEIGKLNLHFVITIQD